LCPFLQFVLMDIGIVPTLVFFVFSFYSSFPFKTMWVNITRWMPFVEQDKLALPVFVRFWVFDVLLYFIFVCTVVDSVSVYK
jgi:hypothetical protein